MEKYGEIKQAKKKLDKLNEDEKEQNMALLREKSLHDEATRKERYFEEGKIEGKSEEKIEIAKELLSRKMSIDEISAITKLSLEEIKKLKE